MAASLHRISVAASDADYNPGLNTSYSWKHPRVSSVRKGEKG